LLCWPSAAGYLLESGFDSLLIEDRLSDLKRLYGLCARVGALGAMCAAFKAHVTRVGGAIVLDESKDAEMIPSLLHLKTRMDRALTEGFSGNATFAAALREGQLVAHFHPHT